MTTKATTAVDEVYRNEWGRIVATLISIVGDFDLAEECAQEAFTAAVDQWDASGVPDSPRAWIIQTAKHKASTASGGNRDTPKSWHCIATPSYRRQVRFPITTPKKFPTTGCD